MNWFDLATGGGMGVGLTALATILVAWRRGKAKTHTADASLAKTVTAEFGDMVRIERERIDALHLAREEDRDACDKRVAAVEAANREISESYRDCERRSLDLTASVEDLRARVAKVERSSEPPV